MNSSGNLISLSDSGMSASNRSHSHSQLNVSLGLFSHADGSIDEGRGGNKKKTILPRNLPLPPLNMENPEVDTGVGMLISIDDEVEVPMPQAILNKAEIDDTFGVFKAQQSIKNTTSARDNREGKAEFEEEKASKLIGSFTTDYSGENNGNVTARSQSPVPECKLVEDIDKPTELGKEEVELKTESPASFKNQYSDNRFVRGGGNESVESYHSNQPTVVMDTSDDLDLLCEGSGILDVKKFSFGTHLSAMSGGSDSEILNINDLSSFSLPDIDIDDDEYLDGIKKEEMVKSKASAAVLNQIKLEMLQENKEDKPDFSIPVIPVTKTESDCRVETAYRTKDSNNKPNRLSSLSSIGSPIRASFPISGKYMPTPNGNVLYGGTTASTNRGARLSESLNSPSRTRVFLHTGNNNQGSPSRVPVRKSISIETLHYHSPSRNYGRNESHQIKFSTPRPSSKNRYAFQIVGEQEDQFFSTHGRTDVEQNLCGASYRKDVKLTETEMWKQPRPARVSFASSTTSVNTAISVSPAKTITLDDYSDTDIPAILSKQMQLMNLRHSETVTHHTFKREGPGAHQSSIQPLRATAAIVPPAAVKKIGACTASGKATATNSNLNITISKQKTTPVRQTTSSSYRRFLPPVAASSPKTAPSPARPASSQTTPSRSRFGVNARSSGYGQQSLNTTFGSKQPLTSPNKMSTHQPPATKPALKPPSTRTVNQAGIPSLGVGVKPRIGASAANTTIKTGDASTKIAPTVGSSFLRRPTTGLPTSNKENIRGILKSSLPSRPRK